MVGTPRAFSDPMPRGSRPTALPHTLPEALGHAYADRSVSHLSHALYPVQYIRTEQRIILIMLKYCIKRISVMTPWPRTGNHLLHN